MLTLILSFWLCFTGINVQQLDSLKHVEIVTEIQDSMALINKHDIDIINKTFYERDILDSLNTLNSKIIRNLELEIVTQDSIITNYEAVVQNSSSIKYKLEETIQEQQTELENINNKANKQKTEKYIWQGTTGALVLALLLVLLI